MDVRLCLTKTPTIHDLVVGRLRVSLPPSPAHPWATGVLLGVSGDLGVSMPWGIDNPPALLPMKPPHAESPSYPGSFQGH